MAQYFLTVGLIALPPLSYPGNEFFLTFIHYFGDLHDNENILIIQLNSELMLEESVICNLLLNIVVVKSGDKFLHIIRMNNEFSI